MRRQWAEAEAQELRWGGISLVAIATGLSRSTIRVGIKELADSPNQRTAAARHKRRAGAGRKRVVDVDTQLIAAVESLIETLDL
jgi:hypothetical protein